MFRDHIERLVKLFLCWDNFGSLRALNWLVGVTHVHHFMVLRDSYGFKRILIIFATSFCRVNHLATDMPGFCLVLLSLRLLQINSVVSVLILL